ncbi:hypothetical protein [Tsukamurella soli]|uniref:hypothetical protein n=1 Tax=Tsukamurella soli TaxID=644556 RepID=UPI0031E97890
MRNLNHAVRWAARPLTIAGAAGLIAVAGTAVAGQAQAAGACAISRATSGWSSEPNSRPVARALPGNRILLGTHPFGPAPHAGMVYGANLDNNTYTNVYMWWDRSAIGHCG